MKNYNYDQNSEVIWLGCEDLSLQQPRKNKNDCSRNFRSSLKKKLPKQSLSKNYRERQAKKSKNMKSNLDSPILAYVWHFFPILEEPNAVFREWVSDFANIFLVPF